MELKTLIHQGQKLTGSLLQVCEGEIHGKPATVSISRDLGFNHKYAHCLLVVPLEKTLLASLPTCPGTPKSQQPFPRDTITIAGGHIFLTLFEQEMLIVWKSYSG